MIKEYFSQNCKSPHTHFLSTHALLISGTEYRRKTEKTTNCRNCSASAQDRATELPTAEEFILKTPRQYG